MTDKTDSKERDLQRIAECAARLVEHADFQLGGVLSADSKARDIPSRACSQVKARHLAALRDALAGRASIAASAGSELVEFQLPPTPFKSFAPGVEIGYDLFGGADIRLGGEFVYVHINYDWRYTHNAARMVLAEQIAGILSGALVTHPSPPEGMVGGWKQLIEAPNNEIVLVAAEFDGPGDWRIKCGYLDGQTAKWRVFGASWEPTHWMPLPPPPASSADSRKGE